MSKLTFVTWFQHFPDPPRDQTVKHTTRDGKGVVARLTARAPKRRKRRAGKK